MHRRDRAPVPRGECKKRKKKSRSSLSESAAALKALTWLFGCDIDYVARRTHSSAVIGPEGHVIGTAALQIPDEK